VSRLVKGFHFDRSRSWSDCVTTCRQRIGLSLPAKSPLMRGILAWPNGRYARIFARGSRSVVGRKQLTPRKHWGFSQTPLSRRFIPPNFLLLHIIFLVLHRNIWVLYGAFWVLHSIFLLLHTTFWVLHSTFWLLYSTFWVLHRNIWLLYSAFWVLHRNISPLHTAGSELLCGSRVQRRSRPSVMGLYGKTTGCLRISAGSGVISPLCFAAVCLTRLCRRTWR